MASRVAHLADGNRWRYLGRMVRDRHDAMRSVCPNCGGSPDQLVGTKLHLTKLFRCQTCRLLYRVPTDRAEFAAEFYQSDYEQGFTTDCPTSNQLDNYLAGRFGGTPKDFSGSIELLRALGLADGARILDFGASWGYGTWQFTQAGLDAVGFEPSSSRARYAREKLGQNVVDNVDHIQGQFDVVFMSHVLEHVSAPRDVFDQVQRRLRPEGLFVSYTPNGSEAHRRADPNRYHNRWGMVHPIYVDAEFYLSAFAESPVLLSSTPVSIEAVRQWDREQRLVLGLDGWELLLVAVKRRADRW